MKEKRQPQKWFTAYVQSLDDCQRSNFLAHFEHLRRVTESGMRAIIPTLIEGVPPEYLSGVYTNVSGATLRFTYRHRHLCFKLPRKIKKRVATRLRRNVGCTYKHMCFDIICARALTYVAQINKEIEQ